ncbi:unnamed protein product [Mytilus edulis]|uniref:Reverse transcriptase RNase H-like domain-containing protein n=1 Tax=Mytilus edulis TaxID=6550 RepID=A0A8S3S415_MYTED|nr:unnamed protein product [Mytilus edulis]
MVVDIPNKTKCVDDVLLWADSIEESFFQAVQWLDICGRHGITLNPAKFIFGQDIVEFAGFEVTSNTVRPCMKYLKAILDFPTPRNITDVRSWFGLDNQVSYAFSMADKMLPFRQLLKSGTPFFWDEHINKLFEESKAAIISEIEEGVRIFDKRWRITLVGSRFTHPAESRYAPVEGEALAVVDALDKARYSVLGCDDLIIAVDHKPLLKIFSDRSLEDISNSRLRNLKEKTLRYRFRMILVPGVKHHANDVVSRHQTYYLRWHSSHQENLRDEVLFALHAAHQGVTAMISRAESSVFWPGITPAISAQRAGCNHCNRIAPSNPSAPPTPLMSPDYPFQCVCSDFFQYKGICYLVIVDQYSNWPIFERSSNGAAGLIT